MQFLATLLGVLNKLLSAWDEHHWKRQGRQEANKTVQSQRNKVQ